MGHGWYVLMNEVNIRWVVRSIPMVGDTDISRSGRKSQYERKGSSLMVTKKSWYDRRSSWILGGSSFNIFLSCVGYYPQSPRDGLHILVHLYIWYFKRFKPSVFMCLITRTTLSLYRLGVNSALIPGPVWPVCNKKLTKSKSRWNSLLVSIFKIVKMEGGSEAADFLPFNIRIIFTEEEQL